MYFLFNKFMYNTHLAPSSNYYTHSLDELLAGSSQVRWSLIMLRRGINRRRSIGDYHFQIRSKQDYNLTYSKV